MPISTGMTAEAIIFAINSAIKLSNNIRRAYAQSIRSKTLVLPLPDFDPNIKFDTVLSFFIGNKAYIKRVERLEVLHKEAIQNSELTDNKDWEEYLEYYKVFHAIHHGKTQGLDVVGDDLVNLLRIRQWETNPKGRTTVLQLVAGTLVEIGIDLLLQVPGVVNTQSAHGRALKSFLNAFDQIPFAEGDNLKETFSRHLLPRLFAAGAESLAELSPEIAEDEKLRRFVRHTAEGIATDLYQKAENLGPKEQREAAYWGQMVLRSMINNAGTLVFNAPEEMFGTNGPVSDIIKSTGGTLLDALLNDDPEKVQFRKAISIETLDKMAHATLAIVAEHPNIIAPGNQKGIQQIIADVAAAVNQEEFQQKGFLPEIARIVLEQSAGHMDTLWEESSDGPKHLLVTAAQQMLSLLSEKHGDAPWRPVLTKGHLLEITEELLDEVVQNPAWITDKAREGSVLSQVLDITFRSLSQIPKEERVNADIVKWLIQLNLQTALTSRQVLEELEWGTEEEETVILQKALELIFHCVFPTTTGEPGASLSKMELLTELTEYVMEVAIRQHPGRRGLVLLELVLFDSGVDYSQGVNRALADELIDASLNALAAHPQLATNHEVLRQILAGVAGAMNSAKLQQPGLLPFLAQLALEHTALNTHLIIDAEQGQPRQLLVTALEHILTALSTKDETGNWRPEITGLQALGLIEDLLDETVRHPEWVSGEAAEGAPLKEVLDAVFGALAKIPKTERLSPNVFEDMLALSLNTLSANPLVLQKIRLAEDEEEKAVIQQALELIFSFVFPSGQGESPRIHLLEELLDYTLGIVISRHPDKRGLLLTELILFDSGIDYSRGFDETLANQLVDAALDALASQPELLARPEALKQIIGGLAAALDSANLKQPGLLPVLAQLVLEKTAMNAGLLIEAEEEEPRYLLVIATGQILSALSAKDEEGNWRPGISPALAHDILEQLLDETVRHPFWITQKVNDQSLLSRLLEVTFRALKGIPQGYRLSPNTLELILQLNLRAAAASPQVLSQARFAGDQEEKAILRHSLDLLFAFLFPASGSGEAHRAYLLEVLLAYILEVIISNHPNKRGLILVGLILSEDNGIDFSEGFDELLANQLLDAALEVLHQQPVLVSRDQALQRIIADIAGALRDSGLQRQELLPELIRLSLDKAASHLDLLFGLEEEEPDKLLAIAARQVLKAIAEEPRSGKWKPRLTNSQIIEIVDIIYETIIAQPQWARREALIYRLLEAVFRALEAVPATLKLAYQTTRSIIEMAIDAANRQPQFLAEMQLTSRGHKHIMLRFALEGLMEVIYVNNSGEEEITWHLSRPTILESLASFYLEALSRTPGEKADFERLLKQIQSAIDLWKQDLSKPWESILATLETEIS